MASANIIYVRFADAWHKLVIDCGVIIWQPWLDQPRPWAMPSEGFEHPLVDVGALAGVVGKQLKDCRMNSAANEADVIFILSSGRTISIRNKDDISTFHID